MEYKFYENSWIPAIKGIFFFIFGLFAYVQTTTFATMSIFFDVLIILIAILYLGIGFLTKGIKNKYWIIVVGFIHLAIGVWLSINYGGETGMMLWIVILWILFSAVTDLIESIILFASKNLFAVLFLINTVATLVFAYFTWQLMEAFTPEALTFLAVVAIGVGLITELTALLLSKTGTLPE